MKPVFFSLLAGLSIVACGCNQGGVSTSALAAETTNAPAVKTNQVKAVGADKVVKSDEEWRKQLTPQQYQVLRQKGTERAYTGEFWNTKEKGTYKCAGCGLVLFESDTKFDSGCGWP